MNREAQVQMLGSLYLLYKYHTSVLQRVGFSGTEAFWLNFTSLAYLPWDPSSENRLHLTQVLRLYLGIYQYNSVRSLEPEAVPAFLDLLVDRYRMVEQIVRLQGPSRPNIELGRFALPKETDPVRIATASSILVHSIVEWQKQEGQDRLPCALVDDVGNTHAV